MPLALDIKYPLSWPFGILQLVEFVTGLVILIILATTWTMYGLSFVWFVSVSSLVCALVFLVLGFLHIPDTVVVVPWALAELVSTAVWAFFYFIAFCVSASASAKAVNHANTNVHPAAGAAAFFCVVGTGAFGFHAFLLFRSWRGGVRMSSSHSTHTTTTTTHTEVKY